MNSSAVSWGGRDYAAGGDEEGLAVGVADDLAGDFGGGDEEAVGSFELVGELTKAGSVDGNTPKSSAGGDEEGLAVGVAEGAVGDFIDGTGRKVRSLPLGEKT